MSAEYNRGDSSNKTVLIVLAIVGGVLVLCILGCLGLFYLGMRTVQQVAASAKQMMEEAQAAQVVAERFLADLGDGQVDFAYKETTQQFQARQTLEQFRAFVDRNPLLKKRTSSNVWAQSNTPNLVTFQASISTTGGQLNCTIHVAKEGDVWKVDRFTIP